MTIGSYLCTIFQYIYRGIFHRRCHNEFIYIVGAYITTIAFVIAAIVGILYIGLWLRKKLSVHKPLYNPRFPGYDIRKYRQDYRYGRLQNKLKKVLAVCLGIITAVSVFPAAMETISRHAISGFSQNDPSLLDDSDDIFQLDGAVVDTGPEEASSDKTHQQEPDFPAFIIIRYHTESVNIRRTPSTLHDAIGKAYNGDRFECIGIKPPTANRYSWYCVLLEDGRVGYISTNVAVPAKDE